MHKTERKEKQEKKAIYKKEYQLKSQNIRIYILKIDTIQIYIVVLISMNWSFPSPTSCSVSLSLPSWLPTFDPVKVCFFSSIDDNNKSLSVSSSTENSKLNI